MPPKITDPVVWHQAELLMQPAFIRIIDNIRQQLDESAWKGTYQDVLIWPVGTTVETKAVVTQLLQQMKEADPMELAEIERTLTQMPTPYPGYHLCLQYQGLQQSVELWELCYQVCFHNYSPSWEESDRIQIDTSLIDETGDVDWQRLDAKAAELVNQVFANLPTV